ncbi:MAG TPA: FMN-binding protein [Acidimicrobiales bacterium]|nr:FMN-binding protein [Acidimicrobiales bacterium]
MKRFPIVLAGAVSALAAVVGLHSRTAAGHAISVGPANAGSANGSAGTTQATSPPTTNPSPSTTNPSPSTTNPPPPTTAPATAVARTSTGPVEQYGYGELSVRVTVTGNKITHLAVPTLQTAEQYSQQLAAQVIPMLTSEVLKAQSINIYGISGATYTAEAYVTSLQSALKNLHFS